MHPAAAHSCHQKHPSKQHGGASARYPNAPHCHGQKQGGETRAKHETSPRKHPHYPIPNILKSSGPIYPLRSPHHSQQPFCHTRICAEQTAPEAAPGSALQQSPFTCRTCSLLPADINKNTSRLPQQFRIGPSCWGSNHKAPRSRGCVSCPASWCPTP